MWTFAGAPLSQQLGAVVTRPVMLRGCSQTRGKDDRLIKQVQVVFRAVAFSPQLADI